MRPAGERLHVPAPPALFVGRTAELHRIEHAGAIRLYVVYGVAGIGKTALALRAFHDMAVRDRARLAYVACRDGESASTALAAAVAQLADTRAAAPAVDPVRGVFEEARVGPIVLVLDDMQRAGDSGLLEACVHLASSSLPIRVCVVSREMLPLSPAVIDHLVVQLGELSGEDAQLLWERLRALYGPPHDGAVDETRFERCAGSPLLLKQAFAGTLLRAPEDRLALAALPPLQALLVTRACAFRRPMPLAALGLGSPATTDELGAARDSLIGRFLLEMPDGTHVRMPEVVREEVRRSPLAPRPDDHRACLEYLRRSSERPDDSDEVLYHAVAAGDDAVALSILEREANQIARIPPGTGILARQWSDAIEDLRHRGVDLPVAVNVLAARIRARRGESLAALDELRALAVQHPMAALDVGAICVALGREQEAAHALGDVIENEHLPPVVRLLAVGALAGELRERGEREQARRLLDSHAALLAALGRVGSAVRCWLEALLLYDDARYDAAASALAEASSVIALSPVPVSLPLLESLRRSLDAARGMHARPARDDIPPGELFAEVPFLRASARALRVQELIHRGEAADAVTLANQIVEACAASGYARLHRRARALRDEAARMLSAEPQVLVTNTRDREGIGGAAHALAALEHGLQRAAVAEVAARAEALASDVREKGWQYLACRADLVHAEAALRIGDHASTARALESARTVADAMRYAALSAQARLVEGALLRTLGHETAVPTVGAFAELATRLGLDDPLTRELLTAGTRRLLPERLRATWYDAPYAFVVDEVAGSIKVGRARIDVRRRPALIALASALARRGGDVVPVATLVRELWGVAYEARAHHSRITMAVGRLRELIGRTTVVAAGDGYRLSLRGPWAVIRPAPTR